MVGRRPWSIVYGRLLVLKRSWVQIPALYSGWTFFHIYLLFACKRPKINKKEAGLGQFFKKGKGMDIRTDLAMTLVSDLLDAPELLLERFGGALLLVAPRPANRLLRRDGLLKSRRILGFVLTSLETTFLRQETFAQPYQHSRYTAINQYASVIINKH